jgi:hypothetical protein
MRMNAADTRASSAIALCTALTFVSRSSTTAAIDTFISDVSTTSTNIAAASTSGSRRLPAPSRGTSVVARIPISYVFLVRDRSLRTSHERPYGPTPSDGITDIG